MWNPNHRNVIFIDDSLFRRAPPLHQLNRELVRTRLSASCRLFHSPSLSLAASSIHSVLLIETLAFFGRNIYWNRWTHTGAIEYDKWGDCNHSSRNIRLRSNRKWNEKRIKRHKRQRRTEKKWNETKHESRTIDIKHGSEWFRFHFYIFRVIVVLIHCSTSLIWTHTVEHWYWNYENGLIQWQ